MRIGKLLRRVLQAVLEPFVTAVDAIMRRPAFALRRTLHLKAIEDSAEIVRAEMPDAFFCGDRLEHLEYALTHRKEGLILEFGVFRGTTIRLIARHSPQEKVYGFDSFRGLPERWIGSRTVSTTMDRGGVLPSVPGNVELIAGWFNETLPPFLANHSGQVGFVHIDCDIYSSTKEVFTLLHDRMAPGCVIVFDEFFGYNGFRQHEYRAFHEFIRETGRKYRFVSYSGSQAAAVLAS